MLFCRPVTQTSEGQGPSIARGAPQGDYVHPLQEQLAALCYPAWLFEATEPLPPKVRLPLQCGTGCGVWVLFRLHRPSHDARARLRMMHYEAHPDLDPAVDLDPDPNLIMSRFQRDAIYR